MRDRDPELERLREAERAAYDRFQRLSRLGAFPPDHVVVKAAEAIWIEARAALRMYQGNNNA